MPHYFFDTYEHGKLSTDDIGVELPRLEDVEREARNAAREILAERLRHDEILNGEEFRVRNEQGEVVLRLKLRDVVKERKSEIDGV